MKRTDKNQVLQKPSGTKLTATERAKQLERICSGFISPGKANRDIYRVILETLLPVGAGVPGPICTRSEFHEAVGRIKPGYKDVFRRVRELQGEEGLHGIIQNGERYQLIHLAVGSKRPPRQPINKAAKQVILEAQGWRCAVCGNPINAGDVSKFDPDHRVPRVRGGGNEAANLQALCPACNNNKSSQCSNCSLDCHTCAWAYPEKYKAPTLRADLVERLTRMARERNMTVSDLANRILAEATHAMATKLG